MRRALRRLLAVPALALGLASCAFIPPGAQENSTLLYGTRVQFMLMDRRDFGVCSAQLVGCTIPLGSFCVVQIDREYFERGTRWQQVNLVAHELAHCFDLRKLSLSHGGFRDEGKRWGPYYSVPSEGFAEAYARAYIRKCGLDLDSLGWQNRRGPCTPPDPREVTPQLVEELGL